MPHHHSVLLPHSKSELFFQIQALTAGRELREEDWPFSKEELDQAVALKLIEKVPGLYDKKGKTHCTRCGNGDSDLIGHYQCARCHGVCAYCRSCLMMGVIKSCTALLRWLGPDPETFSPDWHCAWDGSLTHYQQEAADFVQECFLERQDGLIWAVCGAGKTELLFQGIEALMKEGKRVAIATPRTDVVLELYPRFKKAFPCLVICPQYGGGPVFDPSAKLVITTTHQLLRFYRAFDAMIIDEVDAFPFHYDPMLAFAVQKSMKPHSPTLFLTATPDAKLKRLFKSKQLRGVKIPVRFHGFALPVPKLQWISAWEDIHRKKSLPKVLIKWLKDRIALGHPVFLFVPRISMLRAILILLEKEISFKAETVHANDPDRLEKVKQFRNGDVQLLVTTTILERGVTIAKADVAIFGADDRVFDERALVQMSGRSGRDKLSPNGDVVFFHHGRTREMMRAVKHIQNMNREGGVH